VSKGKYRNKYTDAVTFQVRSTANTNIVYWNGKLLALKEDSLPYAMDPATLETLGLWDFDGQLPALTFTAHPKFDPITREMVCFGYEAKGDGTPDICYYVIGKDGKFVETVWLTCPVIAMIHDFAVTENYVCALPSERLTSTSLSSIFEADYLRCIGDLPMY
jgi:carotenoid cleavage dioxygenase-like enzyme